MASRSLSDAMAERREEPPKEPGARSTDAKRPSHGLLDELEDLEARRQARRERKKGKDDGLDLDSVW